MTAEEFIEKEYGELWLKNDWSPGDVIDALEEYGKHCAEIAFDDGFSLGFIDNQRPSFEEWWSEFQRKETTLDKSTNVVISESEYCDCGYPTLGKSVSCCGNCGRYFKKKGI